MKFKTSDLIDNSLNWCVANALGELDAEILVGKIVTKAVIVDLNGNVFSFRIGDYFFPSTKWAIGGPIIEFGDITVGPWGIPALIWHIRD